MAFLHSKNETKICYIKKGQKTTFEWQKCVPNVIFPRFRGGIWSIKVVSDFRFGDPKCHFWYPQNCIKCIKNTILGVPEMALLVPETKIRDHFYRPNTPPKPQKNHIGNAFLPLESGILAILFIQHVFVSPSELNFWLADFKRNEQKGWLVARGFKTKGNDSSCEAS